MTDSQKNLIADIIFKTVVLIAMFNAGYQFALWSVCS